MTLEESNGRRGSNSSPGSLMSPAPPSRAKTRTRRAAKACLSCRARKVRCDVVSQYPKSCTNCHLDQIDCAISDIKRLTKKTNPIGPNLEILARRSQHQDLLLRDERASNLMDSETEMPPLLSSNNSMTENTSSIDFLTDSNIAHVHARDGPLSSSSDTMRFSFPPEAVTSPTSSNLESTMALYTQNVNETIQAFHDQDASFLDFETFTQNLCDESLPLIEPPTNDHGGQPTKVSQLQSSEISNTRSNDCGCAPPLPWIANWCVHRLDQPILSKVMDTEILSSLAFETVESLLRDYFQFVNPSFPVVSEWDVYRLIHPEEVDEAELGPPMSLALFNAVMFAASAFTTPEIAKTAGFSNIRAMREAFHNRAKVLYEAGCEGDPMNQIRICLLLSLRRKYPDAMFDNERWAVKAQNILEQTELAPLISQTHVQHGMSIRWKILSCCCIIRARRVILGTYRDALSTFVLEKVPQITIADLEEDLRFSWFLEVGTKRKLAQMFVAGVDLHHSIDPICQILLRRDPRSWSTQKSSSSLPPFRRSVMGVLEEVESSLVEWRARYDELLPDQWDASQSSDAASPPSLPVTGLFLKLSYEYGVSCLHQISLEFERSSTTSWAAKMRELSRDALYESAASTTRIIRDLLDHNAVKYLPFSAVAMIFVPLTINSVFLKSSIRSSAQSVHDLSICFRAFEVLAERHEVVDFFLELNNASVMLVHEALARSLSLRTTGMLKGSNEGEAISFCDKPEKVLLPQTDTYSLVLRFLKQSFAQGTVKTRVVTT